MSIGAVRREILVRYLDAWTPAALHTAKRVTYVSPARDGIPEAALRVFGEFVDRMAGRRLVMVLLGGDAAVADRLAAIARDELDDPAGIEFRVTGDLAEGLADAYRKPIFAYLDGRPAAGVLDKIARSPASEVVVMGGAAGGYRETLRSAGLRHATQVELVDDAGTAELLVFATAQVKNLEKMKDAIWAVDEYAGVRYRDPLDPSGTPLEISFQPRLGPLRTMLRDAVAARGACTVADLREYTLLETIYRPADATRAIGSLLTAGTVARDPATGRLSPQTLIRLG